MADFLSPKVTRVADPKLEGGGVFGSFQAARDIEVIVEIVRGQEVLEILRHHANNSEIVPFQWNGRNASSQFVDTGNYEVWIRDAANVAARVVLPLTIARFGLTSIEALSTEYGPRNNWQMVYYKDGETYSFSVSPEIEYMLSRGASETSELDEDNGNPRPVPRVHSDLDTRIAENAGVEQRRYNYPVCYTKGSRPRLACTLGSSGTSAITGDEIGPGYPISGIEVRLQIFSGSLLVANSAAVEPGEIVRLQSEQLPDHVTRTDRVYSFGWQYRVTATGSSWTDVPGRLNIPRRYYTLLGEPQFTPTATGHQYAGVWVAVADLFYHWGAAQPYSLADVPACISAHVREFQGKDGNSFRSAYYESAGSLFSAPNFYLPSLLDRTGAGLNCDDCMGAASTMLGMIGVPNLSRLHLKGSLPLRGIRVLGSAEYTTELSCSSHSFGRHHVAAIPASDLPDTQNSQPDEDSNEACESHAKAIIDTCLQVDTDNNPDVAPPGEPGWNDGRLWNDYLHFLTTDASDIECQEYPMPLLVKGGVSSAEKKDLIDYASSQYDISDWPKNRPPLKGFQIDRFRWENFEGGHIWVSDEGLLRRHYWNPETGRSILIEAAVADSAEGSHEQLLLWLARNHSTILATQIDGEEPKLGDVAYRMPAQWPVWVAFVNANVAIRVSHADKVSRNVDLMNVARRVDEQLSAQDNKGEPRQAAPRIRRFKVGNANPRVLGADAGMNANIATAVSLGSTVEIDLVVENTDPIHTTFDWIVAGPGHGHVKRSRSDNPDEADKWFLHTTGSGPLEVSVHVVGDHGFLTVSQPQAIVVQA